MKIRTYFMDPERMFEYAEIPAGVVVPSYVEEELNDVLWKYWLEHCTKGYEKDAERTRKAIAKKQNGWCSQANMKDAGFAVQIGVIGRMVPADVIRTKLTEILSQHCPC